MNVYLIHRLYRDGAETWCDVVGAFKDEKEAKLQVIEMNEVLGCDEGVITCEYILQEMELK